jgi:signal transduction histidine kinase/FixJ family two-component response regulator
VKPFFTDGITRNRVLLLLPTQRDAELTARALAQDDIGSHGCKSPADLERELERGAGAVFVCEELLAHGAHAVLRRAIDRQPRWSDLPVLILTREGGDPRHVSDALTELGNVMLLERPLRLAALTSNVRTALRARERQYQICNHLDALAKARDDLAEAARRKDQFLAMLGHELRNPLAPVRNALHLLVCDDRLPEGKRALCEMMRRQVDHMVRLVDDLIDVSRISRGTITLRRERVSIDDVLASAIELSRPLIDSAGHRLELDIESDTLDIEADPVRMAQVFGNLLNNAAKYAEPGGRITLAARRDGAQLCIAVRDEGIGIEPEMLPHVFELFTQGWREAHRAHDGLGIGLTLVRNLVEMHGGTVTAASEGRGRGSEFTVRLPLAAGRRESPRADAAPSRRAGDGRPLRVLVVDDNVDSAESMGMVLELLDIEHAVAYDGHAALEVADRFRPDAVLLDIGMPGMDGYEVARCMRADPGHAGAVLIALTGWSQSGDQARSREAGFDHHVSKPVDIGALKSLLAGVDPRRGAEASHGVGADDGDAADRYTASLADRRAPALLSAQGGACRSVSSCDAPGAP